MNYFREFEKSNKNLNNSFDDEDEERILKNKQNELFIFFGNPLGLVHILLSLAGIVFVFLFFLKVIPLYLKNNTSGTLFLSIMIYIFAILIYWIISLVNLYVFSNVYIYSITKNSLKCGSNWGFIKKFTFVARLVVLVGFLFLFIVFMFGISGDSISIKIALFLIAYILVVLSLGPIINFENDLSVAYSFLYKRIPRAKALLFVNLGLAIVFALLLNSFNNNFSIILPHIFNEEYALRLLYIGEERVARYYATVETIKNLVYLSLATLSIKHLYTVLYLIIYNRKFVNTNSYLEQDIKRIETNRRNSSL